MSKQMKMRRTHLMTWTNRNAAIDYIIERVRQGKSFDRAFLEMKKVANKMNFIAKKTTFELMTPGVYTRIKKDCMKRLQEVEENASA